MNQDRTHRLHGGNPIVVHSKIYAFTTTGATKSVEIPLTHVEGFSFGLIGTPASDEILSIDNTVTGTAGEDAAIVGTNGRSTTLVVTRTGASKTSGLKFSLTVWGKD